MNIIIQQDNTKIENLGASGADFIKLLYELAIDPNNTLTLRGNISSTSAYGYQVDYLNTNYSPDFTVSATKLYIYFEDSKASRICASFFGDGVGCTLQDVQNVNTHTFKTKTVDSKNIFQAFNEAGVTRFNELEYFTGLDNTAFEYISQDTEAFTTVEYIKMPNTITKFPCFNFYYNLKKFYNTNITEVDDPYTLVHTGKNVTIDTQFFLDGNGICLDYSKLVQDSFNNQNYINGPLWTGECILKSGEFDGTKDFCLQYTNITKVVFPPDFNTKSLALHRNSSNCILNQKLIFLGVNPPSAYSADWPSGFSTSVSSITFYFPDNSVSAYNNVGIGGSSNSYTLSNYANISDDNKDELLSYGCTATGSTGNWTIKAPGES